MQRSETLDAGMVIWHDIIHYSKLLPWKLLVDRDSIACIVSAGLEKLIYFPYANTTKFLNFC